MGDISKYKRQFRILSYVIPMCEKSGQTSHNATTSIIMYEKKSRH
jgi:hypothetical protein